jgi:hypothetical protein
MKGRAQFSYCPNCLGIRMGSTIHFKIRCGVSRPVDWFHNYLDHYFSPWPFECE